MGNVLTFCETTGSSLRSSALAALGVARQVAGHHGGEVIAILIGKGVADAGADAARYANKVVVVDDAALEHALAETYAPILAKAAQDNGCDVIVATATSTGKDVVPRVAGLLDCGMASEISAVLSGNTYRRPVLAGNAYVTVELRSPLQCLTVRQSEVEPATPLDSPGTVATADPGPIDPLGAEFVRLETSKSERPDLNDADIVVAGGRGMKNGENFKVLEQLCDLLGAALGASRAATDAGFVPADLQVGQTGKVVAPKLYIAVGISGAIQHLAGMKNSKVIVAINKDPEAPIFQVADYGLVSTWEKAIPELIGEIKKLKAAA
ncbi:MAG: electron transfer flavoprotein subunit alpha/FixB family protein [Deltaproteobacteria bacterium]|nr:MAG: electron transfer flavoprotein subunit alpha/FixB family protein [Deltaproteobacteria bacterium]